MNPKNVSKPLFKDWLGESYFWSYILRWMHVRILNESALVFSCKLDTFSKLVTALLYFAQIWGNKQKQINFFS